MSSIVIMGSQWGDEGKGKMTDWLAQKADMIVRYQGGNDADHGKVTGILDMYPYKDQKIIDVVLRHNYANAGLPISTVIFDDQEAWPHEWYIDALAVHPDHWGEHIASRLMDEAEQVALAHGYHIISLNVDKENPRAQVLYKHKGYKIEKSMTIGDRTYDHMIKKI